MYVHVLYSNIKKKKYKTKKKNLTARVFTHLYRGRDAVFVTSVGGNGESGVV